MYNAFDEEKEIIENAYKEAKKKNIKLKSE